MKLSLMMLMRVKMMRLCIVLHGRGHNPLGLRSCPGIHNDTVCTTSIPFSTIRCSIFPDGVKSDKMVLGDGKGDVEMIWFL